MGAKDRQLDNLTEFYLRDTDGKSNIFEVWENGGAWGDSVTPSTYSEKYRQWMSDKLVFELKHHHSSDLLSLGCGNAAIESELTRLGYRVLAVDALEEAVVLARAKGVDAIRADINSWSPDGSWPLIYMDGVLGHLYDPDAGLQPVLKRVRSWLTPSDDIGTATLVASNDSTKDGAAVQPAPGVCGFHWLSVDYLRSQALEAGFEEVSVEEFRYQRPLSGDRTRSILIARVRSR